MHPPVAFMGIVHRVIECQFPNGVPVPAKIRATKAGSPNDRLARFEWLVGKLERHISMAHDGLRQHLSLGFATS